MTQPSPPPDLEGSSLGKYRILKRIGGGSMASVYLAHDPFIDRPVAIKVAHDGRTDDRRQQDFHKRAFFNEAQTAGLLKHPNITAIYDAGVENGTWYIVMEYVHGGDTFEQHTTRDRLLPVGTVTHLLYQCAMALDYAHRQGVNLRDIKPRNILLSGEGEAKITVFGIALAPGGGGITHAGSPLYMSPEQIGRQALTPQSDLFSLGVVAYEVLTGTHPFRATDLVSIERRILHDTPPPLSTWRGDLPAAYQGIIDKALARDCSARYRNGLDLAADLALVFDHLPLPTFTPTQQEKFHQLGCLHFFRGFADGELYELINAATWLEVPPGHEIVREGDADAAFFVLIAGEVAVRRAAVEIVRLRAGDCFGEMGLLARRPRSATIVSTRACTAIKLRDTSIERLSVNTQLRFQRQFLLALIERLDHATGRIATVQEQP